MPIFEILAGAVLGTLTGAALVWLLRALFRASGKD